MSRSSNAAALLLAVLVAFPRLAAAQTAPSQEQVEAARAPFREARELQREGKPAEALARMLEAYRIAPTPVIALEAGRLYAQVGRFVEGRDLLRNVTALPVSPRESEAGRDARKQAADLATALDARVAKLGFAGRSPGIDVLLDGRPLAPTEPSDWVPVDPGAHSVVARAGARACGTIALALAEGESRTVDLAEASRACADRAPPLLHESAPRAAPEGATSDASTRWRWGGALLAGAGLVAIGAGTVLVIGAKGDYDSVSDECTPRGCSASAYDVRHSAHVRANTATIVTSIGAAALIGGGVMWLVLGQRKAPAQIGVGPGSAFFRVALPY